MRESFEKQNIYTLNSTGEQLVNENARVQRDQDEFKKDYEVLLAEHAMLSEKIQVIAEHKRDKVIIQRDGCMKFCFRNGMKCEYPQ